MTASYHRRLAPARHAGRPAAPLVPAHCDHERARFTCLSRRPRAEVYDGSGSTVTFVMDGLKFTMDRPDPRREYGKSLNSWIVEVLEGAAR